MTLAVLLACYNRKELTLRAVRDVRREAIEAGVTINVVVVDDGSTDGTAAALGHAFAEGVQILSGPGNWYWAKSMAAAERVALQGNPDALLWLNDDVDLDSGALRRLLAQAAGAPDAIVVGAVVDGCGRISYSGQRRRGRRHFGFDVVAPNAVEAVPVDAFNGNVVLVPVTVARRLGGIDGTFSHAYADFDYGLRARALGIGVLLAPGSYGQCDRNAVTPGYYDPNRSLQDRLRAALDPKGIPPRSQARFMRRHAGRSWCLHVLGGYRRVLLPLRRSAASDV